MKIRDHNFLGVTSSLCPDCLRVEEHVALPRLVKGGVAKVPPSVVTGAGVEPRLVPLRTSR